MRADEGNAEQHHTEFHGVVNVHLTAQLGEVGRENHAGGNTQAGKSHLRAHGQSGLTAFEPFHNTAAHGDTGHLAAAPEEHEAQGGQLGRSGHTGAERQDSTDNGQFAVPVQVVGEPLLNAGSMEGVADSVKLNQSAEQHHGARKYGSEAHAHLVEDDACKDEEEYIDVEEHFGALHAAERGTVPATGFLHQVLDGG